jgi:hypothetical protein
MKLKQLRNGIFLKLIIFISSPTRLAENEQMSERRPKTQKY